MSCGACQTRLKRLLAALGFEQAITGGWERNTRHGRVLLDMMPQRHTRAALLALCIFLIQGRTKS